MMERHSSINSANPNLRILIADDDIAIRKFISANLIARNYQVWLAVDGLEALTIFKEHPLDLIILDLLMPHMDGIEVCRQIRQKSSAPIIILSASSREEIKVQCLDMGADDFMVKPFSLPELLGRIRAIIRRFQPKAPIQSSFNCGDLKIDFENRTACIKGQEIDLTSTEFSILYYLALNAGTPVSYQYLLQNIWGPKYSLNNRLLWVNISRLRKKLMDNTRTASYIYSHSGGTYLLSKGTLVVQ
jgi:two-component system, OmpR family, KDP operon response regulator KdpE